MEMKQRIIGIIVLVALAVILVPLIFDSEVSLSPPNHLPVASVSDNQTAKNAPKTVAYQAPTIKPAQMQPSSKASYELESAENIPSTQMDQHDDVASNDDIQSSLSEDDMLEKLDTPEDATQENELVATAKQTANKTKTTGNDIVRQAALKLAVQKEQPPKMASSQETINKPTAKANQNEHLHFQLTNEKSTTLKIASEKQKPRTRTNVLTVKQTPNSPAASGVWVVQLGSFSEVTNANKLAHDLKSKGFHAFTERDKSRKNVHRVLVGPAQDRAVAEKTMAQLKSKASIHGIIVRYR